MFVLEFLCFWICCHIHNMLHLSNSVSELPKTLPLMFFFFFQISASIWYKECYFGFHLNDYIFLACQPSSYFTNQSASNLYHSLHTLKQNHDWNWEFCGFNLYTVACRITTSIPWRMSVGQFQNYWVLIFLLQELIFSWELVHAAQKNSS